MSTWRRLADEQFPELKETLVPVDTLVDLYSELSSLLKRSLEANDSALAQRVLAFALWGTTQTKNEQFVHGTVYLFRSVVESQLLRRALWRELSHSQFARLKNFFIDHDSTKKGIAMKEIEQEYLAMSLSRKR